MTISEQPTAHYSGNSGLPYRALLMTNPHMEKCAVVRSALSEPTAHHSTPRSTSRGGGHRFPAAFKGWTARLQKLSFLQIDVSTRSMCKRGWGGVALLGRTEGIYRSWRHVDNFFRWGISGSANQQIKETSDLQGFLVFRRGSHCGLTANQNLNRSINSTVSARTAGADFLRTKLHDRRAWLQQRKEL